MTTRLRFGRFQWTPVVFLAVALLLALPGQAPAQGSAHDYEPDEDDVVVDPALLEGMQYESLGFSRGGRSTAVAGVAGQPHTYYFGASGGGVWKTTDGGLNWTNVSDDHFGVGSIGAIRVAPSDANVVYVGTGSACPRGNIAVGDGIYKSTDAGETWRHIGLRQAGQIGEVLVHPNDPDLVYVAALGHMFGPNEERGVYRSKDGGESWEKVLYISDTTGVVDLSWDPANPRVIYAGAWRAERKPWTMISGSEDGGIYKSTDGGDNWKRLEGGLPTGLVGKTSVAVSPANGKRVWALVEAEGDKAGLYRSDDGGKSWRQVNGERKLVQRPWYYIHVFAHPTDQNTVYVLNTAFYRSIDGGRTFPWRSDVPHGDNHDLWINPDNPSYMVNGNDGGANVSVDAGETWTWQMNQPTAEIYRVFVDNQHPYRVYGSQQDNSTISIPSTGGGGFSFNRVFPDWYPVGGCESGHIAIDPRDPDIVYAGCYGGQITRIDREKGTARSILTYPQLQLGQAPRDLKYRFQWNAPIRIDPHDHDLVYHTSQVVHRTSDGGQSWEVISPDLTTDNPETQDYAGGPITHDSTGVEVYNTIFSFEISPHEPGVLWAGSDDGLVHISRDDGETWTDITPEGMPENGTVNTIEISPHEPGRAFLAVYRYRQDDFSPYIFRTDDYGESWALLTDGDNGIPETHFVRVVREDPGRRGLLYAGTEFGMYVSFDDGAHWQRFQNNLPVTPVTDMKIFRQDMVISTQGRAFWKIDNLTPLHELTDEVRAAQAHLFTPRQAWRGGQGPNGAQIDYWLSEVPEGEVKLEILDAEGNVVRTSTGKAGQEERDRGDESPFAFFFDGGRDPNLPVKRGLNRFTWNLRYEGPEIPEGVVVWGGTPGMAAVPGTYQVRLSVGDVTQTESFEVRVHPDLDTTAEDFQRQFDLLVEVGAKIDELYDGLKTIRDVKSQMADVVKRMAEAGMETEEISERAEEIREELTAVEEQLTQVKSESRQDPINFPPMLDNQLVTLYGYVAGADFQPTEGAYERLGDLEPRLTDLMTQLQEVIATDVAAFNDLVRTHDVPPVIVPQHDEEGSPEAAAVPELERR